MTTVIEKEGKKIREAVSWISEMCKKHPEKRRTSFLLEAQTRFDLSPKEADFLLRKLKDDQC